MGLATVVAFSAPTWAAEYSNTELQLQYGRLKVPKFAGGGEDDTTILTVQNASGYKWGDFFGFIDFLKGENSDVNHFNDYDAYGEMYINFSSAKLLGMNYGKGLLRDIGYVQGFNFDADANVYKILPGKGVASHGQTYHLKNRRSAKGHSRPGPHLQGDPFRAGLENGGGIDNGVPQMRRAFMPSRSGSVVLATRPDLAASRYFVPE